MNKAFMEVLGQSAPINDARSKVLELHGTLQDVTCLYCHRKSSRDHVQAELERLNPKWQPLLNIESHNLKINADGDVDIRMSSFESTELQYRDFRYPPCPHCLAKYGDSSVMQLDKDGAWSGGTAGVVKPAVIFFGENVSNETRHIVETVIKQSDQLLVIGTTLAVLSAQRLVRNAKLGGKRIAILTSGYVRNEESLLKNDDVRIWWRSSDVLAELPLLSKDPDCRRSL
jgi:NAD+-dependent protein deacetylase sirtuin 4